MVFVVVFVHFLSIQHYNHTPQETMMLVTSLFGCHSESCLPEMTTEFDSREEGDIDEHMDPQRQGE